jgi:coenzyme F420-0:L-glutamate ligase / coenzyme F420-1:gamma-L-glutamate ligase
VNEIRIIPLEGVPEVTPGDDLAALLAAVGRDVIQNDDVLVITQKVVSKAEGRLVPADDRREHALTESTAVLRRVGDMVISETRHGFVCANAGVDASNVDEGMVALLPLDPDASARKLRSRLAHLLDLDVAVIISDTFGRAWRIGQTDVAIGLAGIDPFNDYRGTTDSHGHELTATSICVADELAAAAEMVMGKAEGVCAAIVRGARVVRGRGAAVEIVRPPQDDLFR